MAEAFDVAIVGGGHNGLVAAAYLARSGRRVVVLERRTEVGGAAATEEIAPGFRGPTGATVCGSLRPDIVTDLNLPSRGVQFLPVEPEVVALADGRALRISRDVHKTQIELAAVSAKDAEAYPRFLDFICDFAKALDPLLRMPPPNVATPSLPDQLQLARRALKFRRLGKATMQQILRLPPMPIRDALDEWFETELLKATFAVDGLLGTFEGPYSPGTAFGLVHHFLPRARGTAWSFVRGGMGNLAAALAAAARDAGATIRTGTEVRRIVTARNRVTGVETASGEIIAARVVASSADPKRTFLGLVDPEELSPEFLVRIRNYEMNGVVAKVNFALDRAPSVRGISDGVPPHFRVCPSMEYIERAYDDAKYGKASSEPFLDAFLPTVVDSDLAPPGKHVMSVVVQYAPYALRRGSWDTEGERLADRVEAILDDYLPGLGKLIVGRQVLTPRDFETRFGLTEGHIYHGEMTLDQSFVLRPVPGWARYRTPVEGLYLCGSGAHPGGGITGAPGSNAAHAILRDWPRLGMAT